MPSLKLTRTNIDRLPSPERGRQTYMDTELKGFALRVTPTRKTFYVVKKVSRGAGIRRGVHWIKIGDYPPATPETARKTALELLNKLGNNVDPVQERRAREMEAVTLEELFGAYTETRKLTPGTLRVYRFVIDRVVPHWKRKKITTITREMVRTQFHSASALHGPSIGNLYGRVLRALFNFAEGRYRNAEDRPLVPENPAKILSQVRAWNRIERRTRVITPADLPVWYAAVRGLADPPATPLRETISDYLLLLLFTGLRENEGKGLRWTDVDLKNRTFTVRDPKNHQDHTLPLSTFLFDLISRRREKTWGSPFVFPGKSLERPLAETGRALRMITEKTGIEFSLHDLRRSFITIAESLDLPWSVLKRLLNHKTGAADVTGGYIISGAERLRVPMQRITDRLLELVRVDSARERAGGP